MWTSLLLGLVLAAQAPPAANQTGVIAGKVTAPAGSVLAGRAEVVLLPPEYVEVWNTELVERLDNYWENYKPTFIRQKELFLDAQRMAYRDAFQFVVARMRFDNRTRSSELIHDTSDGAFEFRNVPAGRYKIIAL